MASPRALQSPEKELRFTRAAQGRFFFILTAFLLAISLGIVVLATQGTEFEAPRLQGLGWLALLPLLAAIGLTKLAIHCTRHAYVLLTPMGVEIFPLWRPQHTMRWIFWAEIQSCELAPQRPLLLLHFNPEKNTGVALSLTPIMPAQRELLVHALRQQLARQKTDTSSEP